MNQPEIRILYDATALAHEVAQRFVDAAADAIRDNGRFTVALAGGSTPADLYQTLAQAPYRDQIEWDKVLVFFGDERCVPPDHPDSNYGMARNLLLSHVSIPEPNVFPVPCHLPGEAAAAAYAGSVVTGLNPHGDGSTRFDLVLLGLGTDGHVASLFPGMPALQETQRLVAYTQAPVDVRPAVSRITLTLPVLNDATRVWFLVSGPGKAEVVKRVLLRSDDAGVLPASLIQPVRGTVTWFLDEAAAGGLESGS